MSLKKNEVWIDRLQYKEFSAHEILSSAICVLKGTTHQFVLKLCSRIGTGI